MTRVQMPAMMHLMRLGYAYFGKISEGDANKVYDPDTNILLDIFQSQFKKLNSDSELNVDHVLRTIRQELNNDDLGKSFYNRLTSCSPYKLIDFENIENNTFHFTAEFTCKNGLDEFRPDITLFINGLPLVFVEVKKPNNHGGIVAESRRMNNERFPNKRFRRFINITQLMIFSNNMEYDTMGGIVPIQGAFYCTSARKAAPFNCFREENPKGALLAPYNADFPYRNVSEDSEKSILADYNNQVIFHNPEYKTNCDINTPTNRILTSMCSPERLLFILRYGIAYVRMEKEEDGEIISVDQKHIMRYQQMFGSLAVRKHLANGAKSGVIWHTQGSGKTALSFYLTHILSDYYAKKKVVAKFYFIVDRLDLLEQATQEFEARGLKVATANSRQELMAQFRKNQGQEGFSGELEITVVNIQRFAEDKTKIDIPSYANNLQRIFILDEAHRGYKPGGCFLANLFDADANSIKIALTGTPLLKEEVASSKVFNQYFHTYYYDRSIEDGYTLKIIREDIEISWKEKLQEAYDKVDEHIKEDNLDTLVQKKDIRRSEIIKHPNYVKPLVEYISKDLKDFRELQGDKTLAGMIVCETSEQARAVFNVFEEMWNDANKLLPVKSDNGMLTEVPSYYFTKKKPLKAALILHDSDDKATRKQLINDFKKNNSIDILIVFNMLLTGFDAPRLKKLYLGRKLKDHNLLQALTRANRPYKNNRYGRIIDFADIKANFEETNAAYLKELNRFNEKDNLDDNTPVANFSKILVQPEELIEGMKEIHQKLFDYTVDNVEEFSQEIATIEDKNELLKLKKVLETAKETANIVRTFGDNDLKEKFSKLEFKRIPEMLKEVKHHIDIINQKEAFLGEDALKQTIHEAMMDIKFSFSKVGEEELRQVGGGKQLQDKWTKVIRSFTDNIDQDDPDYITLREAFMARFKERGFVIDSIAQFNEENKALDEILVHLKELSRKNKALLKKYRGDAKFARVHKRIREENQNRKKKNSNPIFSFNDEDIMNILNSIKEDVDNKVYDKNDILKKDAYFNNTVLSIVSNTLNKFPAFEEKAEIDDYQFVEQRIAKQYLNQYNSVYTYN